MESRRAARHARITSTAFVLLGCGGATSIEPPGGTGGSGGGTGGGSPFTGGAGPSAGGAPSTGGAAPSTGGGAPVLPDCQSPLANGTPCSRPGDHCGGPCENSWQADLVCQNGTWQSANVVPCGPNASHAPQCHNAFSGGALTPCCQAGGLTCAGKPDGYPGFGCTPSDGSFCSCSCYGGMSSCGC